MRRIAQGAVMGLVLGLVSGVGAVEPPPARGDDSSRSSKNGALDAELGGVPVMVRYGRPTVRGRTLWGDLIPYGKVWRTGADEATTLTLAEDAKVLGQPVEAGTYALFTIPGQKTWTFILNREVKQWGAYKYDAEKDALRVKVKPRQGEFSEKLTFEAEGDTLKLRWGDLLVPIRIQSAG